MKPVSAYVPIAMSLAALAMVLLHVARFGAAREADEGTAAHLFQFLMLAQVPAIAFFATWTSQPDWARLHAGASEEDGRLAVSVFGAGSLSIASELKARVNALTRD